ncbi:MAG: protease inhibitor I42 family protein [Planctomycetes bacterium]|nr:protease inhibitor I42 family protein [Planctomycetota bacterium]
MHLTQVHSGQTVTIAAGEPLSIELPENATTGFRWAVEPATTMQLVNDRQSPGSGIGAAGSRTLTFSGRGVIHLSLRREWEPQPLQFFQVTVQER